MSEDMVNDAPVLLASMIDLAAATYTSEIGVYAEHMVMRIEGRIHVDGHWLTEPITWLVAMPDRAVPEVVSLLQQYIVGKGMGLL
jgi:hypothetical protein